MFHVKHLRVWHLAVITRYIWWFVQRLKRLFRVLQPVSRGLSLLPP
jgi:hypothetical protein